MKIATLEGYGICLSEVFVIKRSEIESHLAKHAKTASELLTAKARIAMLELELDDVKRKHHKTLKNLYRSI